MGRVRMAALLAGLWSLVATLAIAEDPRFAAFEDGTSDLDAPYVGADGEPGPASPQVGRRGARMPRGERLVFKDRITPHWFRDDSRFWYRNDLAGGAKEFILVDAEHGTRAAAFDHEKLAAALTKAAGGPEAKADQLPFDAIGLDDDTKVVRFKVGDATWKVDLATYDCTKGTAEEAPPSEAAAGDEGAPFGPRRNRDRPDDEDGDDNGPRGGIKSPDGKWTAFVKDHNVYARAEGESEEFALSQDGKDGLRYGRLSWAPDSKTLVAYRVEPGENKKVYLIQSSPPGGGRAKLRTRPYPLPGDKFDAFELNLFSLADKKQTKPEVDRVDFNTPFPRWAKDGRHFTYQKHDRGHQRYRLIEVDSHTGESRNLIDEKTETFIWSAHTEDLSLRNVNWLEDGDELIYVSERDGWRHLYLIDTKAGVVKNRITEGEFVVRGIDRIDEPNRQVWFHAGGRNAGQDPYFLQYYRVNFDGSGLVALTDGDGNHSIQFSPGRKYLIDTYSRVDKPPVNELRSTADGSLVCKLEEADASALASKGFQAPEVFVAKGRDGRTDMWGIICKPKDFDPAKKYPVIEEIYAGPQGSYVPKSFSPFSLFTPLTDLGFVVVQVDAMGTANRSKAFHDVCWHNLKDAGFPDRILWHQAIAAKYPWYDIGRVGIYGGSAGGQNSTGGLLFHPEFYKVAVSGSGCHDNRMDKASWNEQWMGYPVGPQYGESSNIDNAPKLRGKLLLIVGELDDNVPPESTLRLADALIKANKDFDMLIVPGAGHGMGGAYGQRRLEDFFVRHLMGNPTPDRNAPTSPGQGGNGSVGR